MMRCERQTTEQAIVAAIARYFDREPDELSVELDLDEDLGADNLGRLGLAFVLEERFGIALDDGTITAWIKVGDVMRSLTSIAGAGHA